MLALILATQAMAYAPPHEEYRPCDCKARHEEVRLDDSFFWGGGGVGPAHAPAVYGGGGFAVVEGGASASAAASASASASVNANISVRFTGGFSGGVKPGHGGGYPGHGGGKPGHGGGKPGHGGGYGGKH